MITNLTFIACLLLYAVGNLIVWFQMNGQFKWDFWNNSFLVGLLGFPISIIFFKATKLSFEVFDGLLWPGRLIAFGISIIIFTILTWVYLGETLTLKTIVSVILACIIVAIQVIW